MHCEQEVNAVPKTTIIKDMGTNNLFAFSGLQITCW